MRVDEGVKQPETTETKVFGKLCFKGWISTFWMAPETPETSEKMSAYTQVNISRLVVVLVVVF